MDTKIRQDDPHLVAAVAPTSESQRVDRNDVWCHVPHLHVFLKDISVGPDQPHRHYQLIELIDHAARLRRQVVPYVEHIVHCEPGPVNLCVH
eukprot:15956-Eustigmatos_ZCMA.PRE.1